DQFNDSDKPITDQDIVIEPTKIENYKTNQEYDNIATISLEDKEPEELDAKNWKEKTVQYKIYDEPQLDIKEKELCTECKYVYNKKELLNRYSKNLPCDNKIPCTFCKLSNKTCKRKYRTSDKTKVLRKIFDAKINLLHTIEEAKLIFESLKEQHDFDKLYEILDNLQDTSDKESGCPNIPQQVKEYTPHYIPSTPV
ncbi:36217_t:CDS:2, partial [Racocetra persica]